MTLASALHDLPFVLFLGLLALAAVSDLREYRIPNTLTLAIAALYPAQVLTPGIGADVMGSAILAVAVLAAGTGLFALGLVGGGDVKLLAAVSLWVGPAAFPLFLIVMALAGGAIALVQLSNWRLGLALFLEGMGQTGFTRVLTGRDVPYGVAIAIGAVFAVAAPAGM